MTTKATAQMGGLTREEILPYIENAKSRIRLAGDDIEFLNSAKHDLAVHEMALQSLSLESVRSGALDIFKRVDKLRSMGDCTSVVAITINEYETLRDALSPARVAEGEWQECAECGMPEKCARMKMCQLTSAPESPAKEQPGEQNAAPQERVRADVSSQGNAPAVAAPDVASMVKFEEWLRTVCFDKPTPPCYDLAKAAWKAALLAKLGQQSHHFTVDLKQFLAPANRMSIDELKAIYGRGGTEFWFVKDPSDKKTGRHYFHDSEIVDLKFTSEFYVDLPARM